MQPHKCSINHALRSRILVGRLFGSRKEKVPFMHKRKAFTLIELLVVIAIIALLMAILVPALRRVRKQAKAVACQAHLHQWALIWSMYTDDNDGRFHRGWGGGGGEEEYWIQVLRPYYSNVPKIRYCPEATKSAKQGARSPFNAWATDDYSIRGGGSYGVNSWICDPRPAIRHTGLGATRNFWRSCHVKGASNIPMFQDQGWPQACPDHREDPPEYDGVPAGHMGLVCLNRHNGSINGAFLDFSVRKIGLKELWKLKWHREFDTNAGPTEGEWPDWMKNSKE